MSLFHDIIAYLNLMKALNKVSNRDQNCLY